MPLALGSLSTPPAHLPPTAVFFLYLVNTPLGSVHLLFVYLITNFSCSEDAGFILLLKIYLLIFLEREREWEWVGEEGENLKQTPQ